MKFSIFKSAKSQRGEECTYERYLEVAGSAELLRLCNDIAAEADADRRGELKKRLPVVTWQAYFPNRRVNKEAEPSGLFMLDIDHVDNPFQLYSEKVAGRIKELGIVYCGKTASGHGLRIVARCLPTLNRIEDCQRWLAANLKVEFDGVCKDWARCSFLVHDSYTYFMDAQAIWQAAPAEGTIYGELESQKVEESESQKDEETGSQKNKEAVEGCRSFRGVALETIAKEWLEATGGEPVEGERNTRIHALAYEMRYITDFNERVLLEVLPRYGLSDEEMRALVHSACLAPRSKGIPRQLEQVVKQLTTPASEADDDELLAFDTQFLSIGGVPTLPPLIRQLASKAPADFVVADILCQLPLLGALGSKLRARYLDGRMHSPSFQVSLEAPQASGKSFMARLAELLLQPIVERDQVERQKEQEYNERLNELKVTGVKVTAKNREEMLGQRPKGVIRYVPATISITKMLMRMENARGLHLMAVSEEIDTVTKAFKRGFSSYSDALRVSFDNGPYGQDYASENSYSGILPLYYNTLFSGTPQAMRRFYPDVEDGLVSRVCFVTLPDQFGKPMPVWGELSERERREVKKQVERLDAVSIVGDVVQPDHVMELDFLNRSLEQWLREQQQEAVRTGDRTRDIFCRRAAVVGFRAGMLAWFLYGEKDSRTYRKNTIDFARWVANQMLTQHLLRFQIEGTGSNTNRWEEAYRLLGDEFTREELQKALVATGSDTRVRQVVYRWQLLGCIEVMEEGRAVNGCRQAARFKKKK